MLLAALNDVVGGCGARDINGSDSIGGFVE